jgi:cobalt-zinc-cadmium efflux system membrane fusion protein
MKNLVTQKQLAFQWVATLVLLALAVLSGSCSRDPEAAPAKTEVTVEPGTFNVAHPELFKLATVQTRSLPAQLTANGTVDPDITRTIHVTSLGSGRVVDLRARLGDYVKKGQTLLVISSPDLASANADYQKAHADEELAQKALARNQELYSHGALAAKDMEEAQDTEEKAKVDMQAAAEHVRVLGGDPDHSSSLINLRAPVSGTIVEQNVAGFEGIKSLDNTPNLFTIADLSQVWVVCDVFENDLGQIRVGDPAEIRLNAYPDRAFHGTVSDISRVLDPNTRSAKVRVVLPNADGTLRPGMFAVATLHSRKLRDRVVVPSTAVMRLQDKDWVFRKETASRFRQVEVHTSGVTPDGLQSLQSGLNPGDEVISDALQFSTAMSEQKE